MLGDALIAHELAHVVQQSGASESVANIQVDDAGYDTLERDADNTAVNIIGSLWGQTLGISSPEARHLQSSLRSGLRLQRCATTKPTPKTPEPLPAPPQQSQTEPEQSLTEENAGCSPVAESISNLTGAGPGTLGTTKIDQSSQLICAPAGFTFNGQAGTCTYTTFPISLKINAKYAKVETEANTGETMNLPECNNQAVPVLMTITQPISQLARAGELEHCADLTTAFNRTLVPCAAELKKYEGQPLTGANDDECYRSLVAKVGFDPINCTKEFLAMSKLTEERDSKNWHSFDPVLNSKNCTKIVVGNKKSASNRVNDPSVAPSTYIPAATKCSAPATLNL
jgi:hypothetical protein